MLRFVRVNALVLLVLAISAPTVRADVWDWLDELKGPGPSHSRGNITATIRCEGAGGWFRPLGDQQDERLCFFADVRRFKSSEEDLKFNPARIEIYEAGPTVRLVDPIEIGVGVGVMHSDSSGIKTTRMTISFPRVVFKPLMLIPLAQKNHNLGFFQVYFRENRVFGEFTEANFNPKGGYEFHASGEVVKSFGFMIDLPLALRAAKILR